MSGQKDASGYTPQERHQIITDYLKKINKPAKVFHLRWKPGEVLTGKVLETTPMFWYMKYGWTRPEIEEMFYLGRCVIGPLFDQALQQTFGGSEGRRWRGAIPQKEKSKWRQRQAEKLAAFEAEEAAKLKQKEEEAKKLALKMEQEAKKRKEQQKEAEKAEKLRKNNENIWNAVSDFGADKSIDYKTFSDNLKNRSVNVSHLLAKQLFDELGGKDGKLTKKEMDELIQKLDLMNDALNVNVEFGVMTIMKRVLLAAGAGEPFNVDDFVFAQKLGVTISPIQFMNKLSDRDVGWDDRVRAMEQLGANLGSNPLFNNVLANGNIPELLCGWATQILDNKPEVQKTAIETMPDIFHKAMEFGDKDIAVGYLEEVLDNLFKVLDDPNSRKNHQNAKKAIAKLIDDIVENGDPESVLLVSHILAEKCDIENANNPETRKTALVNLEKIMFGPNNPITADKDKLPPPGSVNREWLDIATNQENFTDSEVSNQKPRNVDNDKLKPEYEKKYDGDVGPEETMSYVPPDPAGPAAKVTSDPTIAKIKQPVNFDASKSHDCDNEPCKTFKWDFGDGTPNVITKGPYTQHPYEHPGTYPVTVTVTDKYGKNADASLQQKVIDPKKPNELGPPYAALSDEPDTTKVNEPVTFDASKSHDFEKKPCTMFVFDFGDGSKPVHSEKPIIEHSYKERGAYPVTCHVTDKHGQKAKASLTHRVIDPSLPDPLNPFAAVSSTPTEANPNEPVTFDASKSKDCDGDPIKKYVWDFGDGTKPVTTTTPTTTHKYPKPGAYPVKVTVTDKYGKNGDASLTQRVKDPRFPTGPPYAAVTNNPPESDINEPVTFDASKSHDFKGNPCNKFVWEFGDNTPKVTTFTPITQHPYDKSGSFPVKVTVYDTKGQPAIATVNQRVRAPEPIKPGPEPPYVAVSSTPTNAKPKEPVKFDASDSHDMDKEPCKKFLWDYGDGSPVEETTTPITKHVYDEPGTYPVKVTAIDKYGQPGNAKLTQRVQDPQNPNKPAPPYAHITSDPPISDPKQPVKFDASKSHDQFSKPCKSFVWDFGDNTPKVTTSTPTVEHPYDNPGTYPVSVTVTDKNGLSSQATLNQKVRNPPEPQNEDPYVAVSSTPNDPNPKEPVLFDASNSVDQDGDPCKSFVWDFGDGSPPVTTTTPITNHIYDKPGSYPVSVTATDKYGRNGDAKLRQKVLDPQNPKKIGPPYASVRSSPQNSNINEPVFFDASKSKDFENKPCTKFVWDFGDNSPKVTTTEPYTKHPYKSEGVYPVNVTVTDKHNQSANASLNQRVRKPEPMDPYAHLSNEPPESKPKEPVTFDASKSIDCDGDPCKNFVFDFGDGTPPMESESPIVKHSYDEPGSYPVYVTVTDKNGKKGNASVNQRIVDPKNPKKNMPPIAKLTSDPPQSKPKEPVTFDASKSLDQDKKPCVKFVWDFGDGSPQKTTKTPVVKHPYAKPGAYPVTVEVTDKLGQSANASLQQRVFDPEIFDSDPSKGPKGPKKRKYGGPKGQRNGNPNDPNGVFGSKDDNKNYGFDDPNPSSKRRPKPESKENEPEIDPEIGDEFRNVVHDAISKAIMDPNKENKKAGTNAVDVLNKLDPTFKDGLDPDAKKRYEWSIKPFKPKVMKKLPPNPKYKSGNKALHRVEVEVNIDANKGMILPDI